MSFALAISMTDMDYAGSSGTPNSAKFVSTTLIVVMFTTLFCGAVTPKFLTKLGLHNMPTEPAHSSKKNQMWSDFDQTVLKPFLLNRLTTLHRDNSNEPDSMTGATFSMDIPPIDVDHSGKLQEEHEITSDEYSLMAD